jgi:asparagine synthase (glutamine-hydrolysing)
METTANPVDVDILAAAVKSVVTDSARDLTHFTLLFSGGLDSSIIAWVLKEAGHRPTLLAISLPGGTDAAAAESSARCMGLECRPCVLTTEEAVKMAKELRERLPHITLTDLSVQTSMALALSRSEESTVLCGQGADELFLGYAHFRGLTGEALLKRAEGDMDKLLGTDWPTTVEIARSLRKEVRAPYLNPVLLEKTRTISWDDRQRGRESKWILREAARRLRLPEELASRPKKAFQYGSGIYKVLRRDREFTAR